MRGNLSCGVPRGAVSLARRLAKKAKIKTISVSAGLLGRVLRCIGTAHALRRCRVAKGVAKMAVCFRWAVPFYSQGRQEKELVGQRRHAPRRRIRYKKATTSLKEVGRRNVRGVSRAGRGRTFEAIVATREVRAFGEKIWRVS